MCKAQIKLGPNSFGNVDMLSFCDLYRASLNKVHIDINSIDESTVSDLKDNVKTSARNNKDTKEKITASLLHYGEIKAMKWVMRPDIQRLK
eukprot:734222_1